MKHIYTINEYVKNETNAEYLINRLIKDITASYNYIDHRISKQTRNNNLLYVIVILMDIFEKDLKGVEKMLKIWEQIFAKNELILSYTTRKTTNIGDLQKYSYDLAIKSDKVQRIKPPKYVYHVTYKKNEKSILKNGLKPIDGSTWNSDLYYKPAIFASSNIDKLWSYIPQKSQLIVQIDTENLNNKWYLDLNLNKFAYPKDADEYIMTYEPIPPENIKIIEN